MTKSYRDIIQSVSRQLPNLIVVDPTDVFCDEQTCAVIRNGVSYYSYSDHMSDTSAALSGKADIEGLSFSADLEPLLSIVECPFSPDFADVRFAQPLCAGGDWKFEIRGDFAFRKIS